MSNVSPYFNHYSAVNEQNLIQDLVDESIYQRGLEISYVPRTQDNIDFLYKEDTNQSYDSFKKIAMYPASVDGFDGMEMMGMFGNEFKKSATFLVSKRKWSQIFPEFPRPREGDVLFMPVTNAILEIKFVETESPFFEKGKQYVFELKTEAFEYSHEDMVTGDTDLDELLNNLNVTNPETTVEDYGDNVDIETEADNHINFDPQNPFGVN